MFAVLLCAGASAQNHCMIDTFSRSAQIISKEIKAHEAAYLS